MPPDIGDSLRSLTRRPLSTAAAVATLAVGIGLTTAVFSVFDWVLVRPLPYPSPHEIVRIYTAGLSPATEPADLTDSEFTSFSQASAFRATTALSTATRLLAGQGLEPSHVVVARVSGDLFSVLGIDAQIGRRFGTDEVTQGARIVVVSHQLWANRFADDPAISGRVVTIDGVPHTVVGVMPLRYGYPVEADLWRPLTVAEREDDDRENLMLGRLAVGVAPDQASAELGTVAATASNRTRTAWVEDIQYTEVRHVRAALTALLASAALLLLMTCANIASLLGARGAERAREMIVRGALGASRARLVRQLLTESTVLVAAGGLAGVLLGQWALNLLIALAPGQIPRLAEIALDRRVAGIAFLVTIIVGLATGIAPALRASRVDLRISLGDAGPRMSARRTRTGVFFLMLQAATAVVLVMGAGLLGQTLRNLMRIEHGFVPDNLVAVDLYLRGGVTGDVRSLYRDLIESAESVSGVRSAAVALRLPTEVSGLRLPIAVEGFGDATPAILRPVTPRYFETAGIRVMQGRSFTADDRRGAQHVAIVNEAFVRDVLGARPAIGSRLAAELFEGHSSIVGIVGDVTPAGQRDRPAVYVLLDQVTFVGGSLLVRTVDAPPSLLPALVARLRTTAPRLALDRIHLIADVIEDGRGVARFNAELAGAFGLLAMLLAAIGVYGLTAGEVSGRWQELAIRLALGASRRAALWSAIQPATTAVVVGMGLGFLATLALGRWIAALLYGLRPADPATLVTVAGGVGALGFIAAMTAARRVLRADPAEVLRTQ
jgi:putative ABC transport system permease protein